MPKQIVLVEDHGVIRENYTELLSDEGFIVKSYKNRKDAMVAFNKEQLPDLAILDIDLGPDDTEGGFQLCMHLRQKSPTLPILFLTSRNEEDDKIFGFRLGADDYLTKDSSIKFLVVRINALLQRHDILNKQPEKEINLPFEERDTGELEVDIKKLLIYWKGSLVELTLTQFWIVQELYAEPRQVKSYRKLMEAASICVEQNTITAHIKTIRSRFKLLDEEFNCIRTERGIGYRWLEE